MSIFAMFIVGSRSPYTQFRHVDWFGYTLADLVYPVFLFVIGFSMILSSKAKDARKIPASEQRKTLVKRLIILFALGLFLRSVSYSRPYFNLGTLQCIALSSFLAYAFVRSSTRTRLLAVCFVYVLVFLSHTLLRPAGVPWELRWVEGYTAAEYLDILLISEPRGPEGTLTTLAVVPFILYGQIAAGLYLGLGVSFAYVFRSLIGGLTLVLLGHLLGAAFLSETALYVPISPQLMTPSFSLAATGWCLVLVGLLMLIIECWRIKLWAHPFAVLGSNAIAVYVFVKLSRKWIFNNWTINLGEVKYTFAQAAELLTVQLWGTGYEQLARVAYQLTAALLLGYFLWRRKIFLRL